MDKMLQAKFQYCLNRKNNMYIFLTIAEKQENSNFKSVWS